MAMTVVVIAASSGRRVAEVADEGLVDLQRGDRQALEVGQRGIAGAEVVHRQRHAQPTEGAAGVSVACSAFAISTLSVSSSSSWFGGTPVSAAPLHGLRQVAAQQLQRRDVHRHQHVVEAVAGASRPGCCRPRAAPIRRSTRSGRFPRPAG
jgi:hypothetical protein